MVAIGYALSSEEHRPNDLVRYAAMAEDAGFTFALISDHFHPWVTNQGQSPFVWATLGGIARATERLRLGTGVTCPIMRVHPAIIAQAAATVGDMFEGRFFLGLGAGENLNEHVIGEQWPQPAVRQEMLQEAVEIIRALWEGDEVNYFGTFFTVDEAKLFTVPERTPDIYIAASGGQAARLAGEQDGLISTSPQRDLVESFEAAGGRGKPRIGQFAVCYGEDVQRARQTAHRMWPNAGIPGNVNWEVKTVEHFDQLVENVTEEQVAQSIICGPDPAPVLEKIQAFVDAGFDHVYIHQVGHDQEAFFDWASREIVPKFQQRRETASPGMAERQLGR